ncbi:cyclic nucleotide-binding protein [Bacterioplanes sanyensis]|uniref:Cyclic nucleotide-binding protein n=1 Tax=Bacterioplanes sanyensis TaxID=1249553 RepID=A0A222FND8_9GAMM|nr:cyclic nucleotide-binding domain-containing protein [Bacterioplanes sanyensis]ASP40538.1 cyclic nucleotide-binding protein [Bacterioplanes sanyensis]
MHRVTREEYPIDSLQRLVNGVTFFKDLIQTDSSQFELLMSVSQFVTADPDETIIHRGDDADTLYFLLRGQLIVLSDDDSTEVINEINPGEMFGVMAMLLNHRRSASIRVKGRNALLAGIDYRHVNDVDDFGTFTLATKISFFRMLSNNLRWTLERNKMEVPDHPLVSRLRKLPLYTGPKNTVEELHALKNLSHQLAELLSDWNASTNAASGDWMSF